MQENSIILIINNYKGKKVTYKMPANGTIESWKSQTTSENGLVKYVSVGIELNCPDGIEIKREEID